MHKLVFHLKFSSIILCNKFDLTPQLQIFTYYDLLSFELKEPCKTKFLLRCVREQLPTLMQVHVIYRQERAQ